jgi:hypothetical protein
MHINLIAHIMMSEIYNFSIPIQTTTDIISQDIVKRQYDRILTEILLPLLMGLLYKWEMLSIFSSGKLPLDRRYGMSSCHELSIGFLVFFPDEAVGVSTSFLDFWSGKGIA